MMTNNDVWSGPQDTPHRGHSGTGLDPHAGHETNRPEAHSDHAHGGHVGHNWMMLACCVPMLVIAVALVASGTAGAWAIVVALGCTLMMALMMGGMGGMGGHGHGGGDRP
jgi:hypothetical protein